MILSKVAMQKFKQKALRTPNEILAVLTGTVTRENDRIIKVQVEDLYYPILITSTGEECNYTLAHLATHQIRIYPKAIIGTLHSHPNTNIIHISPNDLAGAEEIQEIVFGVLTWWLPEDAKRRETSLDFYCQGKAIKYTLL